MAELDDVRDDDLCDDDFEPVHLRVHVFDDKQAIWQGDITLGRQHKSYG